ncbi:uncharacterized protein LOC134197421 isoform X2 [Corticium candelabrum]|uniref:uncharacterized protein LOC134197421 isoform X2 n=1 Tax=Corticium candelabrum TaxID=121492 RepID=UPI002E271517|nr:uncharacterized protein LOC134197421 isoform X2 [Corticium candelabrum]
MSTSQQNEYEQYIISNMVELVQTLSVSAIIDHLLLHRLVTMEERHRLMQCSTEQARSRMLLCEILPYKGNDVVGRLCKVLVAAGQQHIIREVLGKEVGQTHVVQRLTTTGNTQGIGRHPQVAAPGVGEMEMLKDQVVQSDREKRKVTVQLEKELCTAREEIRKTKEETSQARQETGQAKQEMKKAMIEAKGERLKTRALEYEISRCPASHYHQTLKTTDVDCCYSAGVTFRSETRRKDSKDGGPHSAKNSANWSLASASGLQSIRCDRTVLLIGRTGAGKSTCANVLAGDDPGIKFKTSDGPISETKKVQSEIATVYWFGKTYKVKIVDTIGIGNTRLDENEVFLRLAHAFHKCKDGINAVYFVVKDRFTKEEADAWEVMCNVLLGKNIFNYTAIVRTHFRDFSDSKATFDDFRRLIREGGEAAKRILPGIQHFIYVNNPDPLDTEKATALRAASRKELLGHLIDNCFDVFRPPILCKIQQRISAQAQASEESTEELIELQRLNDKLKKCEDYVRRAKLEKEIEVEKRKKAEAEAKTMKEMTTIGKEQATELGIAEEYLGTVPGATGRVIDRLASRSVAEGVVEIAKEKCSVM